MTDREKLDEYIRLREAELNQLTDSILSESFQARMYELALLKDYTARLYISCYKPSGRACFDKPAGVAILHEETL